MARLFVDLDGVLADFDRGATDALGMAPDEFQRINGPALMWKRLAATPEFYARLKWTADGQQLWEAVLDKSVWPGPMPMILSGLPLGDWAQPQKREWCALQLGLGVPVMLCMSIEKKDYCCPGDILIDDRASARLDWETAGGRFILHTSATESVAALRALVEEPRQEQQV